MKLLLVILFIINPVFANSEVELEELYQEYAAMLDTGKMILKTNGADWDKKSMVLVDRLWDAGWHARTAKVEKVRKALKKIDYKEFAPADQIRLYLLAYNTKVKLINQTRLLSDIYEMAMQRELDRRALYTLLSYQRYFKNQSIHALYNELDSLYPEDYQIYLDGMSFTSATDEELQDLFHSTPPRRDRYADGVSLFMFCRKNRKFPCMMLMKDKHDNIVLKNDGSIWSQPKLGASSSELPYYVKNGNTPSGVYTVDSVMPEADRQRVFGKFRRLILNFIPASDKEEKIKQMLPLSAHDKNWWKEGVVARDVGRNLLRIHGTLLKNNSPNSSWYPFVRTSGCIASREGKYGKTGYKDQRSLLDTMMRSMEIEARFENETRLKGHLYVIDIDDKKRPVNMAEIRKKLAL